MTAPHPGPLKRKDALLTRERLVRAALDLFTAQGYRATTTLEIAARARIAEATIYRHFPGKEALFNEACRQALQWGIALVKSGERGNGSVRERLHRIARALVEQVPKDRALVVMLLRRPDGAPVEEPTAHVAREFREGLAQLIAAGKQEGAIRAGSADLWAAVWLALMGFVVERVAAREWAIEHPGVAATFDAAWDAIAARS